MLGNDSLTNNNQIVDLELKFISQLYKYRWSKLQSFIVHILHILGHSNLIYFPYLCAKHGGGFF